MRVKKLHEVVTTIISTTEPLRKGETQSPDAIDPIRPYLNDGITITFYGFLP